MLHPEVGKLLPDDSCFEDWLFMKDPEGSSNLSKTHFMLSREPASESREQNFLWRQLRHMSLLTFKKYWDLFEDSCPLFDEENAYFHVWEHEGIKISGMRHKETGERHGICREILPSYGVVEASYKNGKINGIQRLIFEDKVIFCLLKEGKVLADIYLDDQLIEFGRNGIEIGLLNDLQIEDFVISDYEPMSDAIRSQFGSEQMHLQLSLGNLPRSEYDVPQSPISMRKELDSDTKDDSILLSLDDHFENYQEQIDAAAIAAEIQNQLDAISQQVNLRDGDESK